MWEYPSSQVKAVSDTVHNQTLIDNYRWLEDSDSPQVLAWSKAQNRFTAKTLKEHGNVEGFKQELTALSDYDGFGLPVRRHDYYYWSERKAGTNQPAVYRKKGFTGKPELLLDPNGRREDDAVTITLWNISPEGTYFVYCLSEGGTEMGAMYLRDLRSGEELEIDTIPYCRHPGICWLGDETGFFYTRNPEPGTVPKGEEQYHQRVYGHEVGRNYQQDPIIFGESRHKEDSFGLGISDDRTVLIISAGRDWLKNEIWTHDIDKKSTRVIIKDLPARFGLKIVRGKAYMWTNYQAEFGCALISDAANMPTNIDDWKLFIPERNYAFRGTAFTKDFIVAIYLKDAHSIVELLDEQGNKLQDLELPEYATFESLSCRPDQSDFFYGFATFLTPLETYRYDPDKKRSVPYRSVEVPIDPANYTVNQEWYQSKDGTEVPMFIVRGKGVKKDGKNPTLLYGYGGYNISETPAFIRGMLPFLNRGGVYVIANIRGGGEYGHAWHIGGILENKQNSFDDFIAAAEYLIAAKYTNQNKLAIMGGSNGGLLVGACLTQRPELFKAVVCRVPLLDMVRFPKFLIASRWTSEYGDPAVKADFDRIIKWSPYHNVRPDVEYPATLFATADHDTRVEPLHARKMTALLQATNKQNPILVRTEIEAGHGAGTPLKKSIDAQADILAFLAWQLDLSDPG